MMQIWKDANLKLCKFQMMQISNDANKDANFKWCKFQMMPISN